MTALAQRSMHSLRSFARDIRPGRYRLALNATDFSRPAHAGLTYRDAVRAATSGLEPGNTATIYRGSRPIATLVRNGDGSVHTLDHATGRMDGRKGMLVGLENSHDLEHMIFEAIQGSLDDAVEKSCTLLAAHPGTTTALLLQHMRTIPELPRFFQVHAHYGAGEWVVTHRVSCDTVGTAHVHDLIADFQQELE